MPHDDVFFSRHCTHKSEVKAFGEATTAKDARGRFQERPLPNWAIGAPSRALRLSLVRSLLTVWKQQVYAAGRCYK
jgi:hypothetical protein